MEEKAEWELKWNDSPGFEDSIIFRQIRDSDGAILREFSLQPPDHGKLYYALMDWFMDENRDDVPRPILDRP